MIDLRSDTVTTPSPAMLDAMVGASIGDDVFGDDPTVNLLQQRVADLLGKEAALYVPSGTMSNQIALRCHTSPGDQIICEDGAHIYRYEGGAPAVLSGITVTCIKTPGGTMTWELIAPSINPDNIHCSPPRLICIENTHNRAGGRVISQDIIEDIAANARKAGLSMHLDGARLWNSHVASGIPFKSLADPFDSVSVCFSKGLGAPVGSVLSGSRKFIDKAIRVRKMLGGGMRQSGLLAAACIYGLDNNIDRLAIDHENAQTIASGVDNPLLEITHPVETNIIVFAVSDTAGLIEHLEKCGVKAVLFGTGLVRMVTNLTVSSDDAKTALTALNSYTGENS
ncbi:low-specificity L-threonine aldolase [bacterium]|jgi:threonine aldolase|nr:low-specificity L-threonine aldolase [bacterium]MBT7310840.1 low-specificity L-threonine aldolase [bacterium]